MLPTLLASQDFKPFVEVYEALQLKFAVPIITFALLCIPNKSRTTGTALFIAGVVLSLWAWCLPTFDIENKDASLYLVCLVATLIQFYSFRAIRFTQIVLGLSDSIGKASSGCSLIFFGILLVPCFLGFIICPPIWALIALAHLISSGGSSGGGGTPIPTPPPGPISTPTPRPTPTPISTPTPDSPHTPEWREISVPYEVTEMEPYEVEEIEPYTAFEPVETHYTEVSKNLVLHGDRGEMTIRPSESPFTMVGMKYATLCSAAPGAGTLLYKLTADKLGEMWMLILLPGHNYTLQVNGSEASRAVILLPGMSLSLKDATGNKLAALTVELQKQVRILTKTEQRQVTRQRKVKRVRHREKKVTKYRLERVRV